MMHHNYLEFQLIHLLIKLRYNASFMPIDSSPWVATKYRLLMSV